MLNPLNRIKSNKKKLDENSLLEFYHDFMCCYGWIPYDEFKDIPVPMVFSLGELIQKDKIKKEKFMLILARFAGYKNKEL